MTKNDKYIHVIASVFFRQNLERFSEAPILNLLCFKTVIKSYCLSKDCYCYFRTAKLHFVENMNFRFGSRWSTNNDRTVAGIRFLTGLSSLEVTPNFQYLILSSSWATFRFKVLSFAPSTLALSSCSFRLLFLCTMKVLSTIEIACMKIRV